MCVEYRPSVISAYPAVPRLTRLASGSKAICPAGSQGEHAWNHEPDDTPERMLACLGRFFTAPPAHCPRVGVGVSIEATMSGHGSDATGWKLFLPRFRAVQGDGRLADLVSAGRASGHLAGLLPAGSNRPTSTPMMAITTSSSISVKP
jgi:hypothetical protein